ncbi:MAG TPA: hypothetical protein VI336_03625 [Candidatus Saccharimonadales bacterium]|nr:hypothetical protein [Candidatus Saccharimonadales bacterium]
MSEILTPPEDINNLVDNYRQELGYFAYSVDLPPALLQEPDHMMLKAADPVDFAEKVREIKPWTDKEEVAFMQLDWRFLAIARLVVPYTLASSRHVDWLEIMEPKEARGYDYIGVEYASFYYPDINKAEKLVSSQGIRVERLHDESRHWRWLNIIMNDSGQEVRISDTRLATIVEQELQDETARLI